MNSASMVVAAARENQRNDEFAKRLDDRWMKVSLQNHTIHSAQATNATLPTFSDQQVVAPLWKRTFLAKSWLNKYRGK